MAQLCGFGICTEYVDEIMAIFSLNQRFWVCPDELTGRYLVDDHRRDGFCGVEMSLKDLERMVRAARVGEDLNKRWSKDACERKMGIQKPIKWAKQMENEAKSITEELVIEDSGGMCIQCGKPRTVRDTNHCAYCLPATV